MNGGFMFRRGIVIALLVAVSTWSVGCGSTQRIAPQKHVPVAKRPTPPPPTSTPKVASTPPAKAPVTSAPAKPTPSAPTSTAPTTPRGELVGARIVVDAGHGGTDPGTKGLSSAPEKTITLSIAKELAAELEDRGARVTMTRTRDVFIELDRRAATADKTNADLLVSVHADSHADRSIAGATIYVARDATARSKRVADAVLRSFKAAGIATRGVRNADFRVLAGHRRPSILVECGYLTNPTDAKNLGSEAYRDKIATVIASGIADGI